VPLYRFDVGGAKGKYVGASEGNMLANLARLDNAEPCVCLVDEIEKVFSAKSGDSDSGTTTTMLSQLLWWLAEHKSRVLTIMTTNNAKALPPELYREGRIDEVIVFEGLTGHDAASFIEGVLATFLSKGENLSVHANKIMNKLFPATIGFTPQQTVKRYSQAYLTKMVYEYIKTK
jgi:ATP-dependent 26S proteasome regulatory subunit